MTGANNVVPPRPAEAWRDHPSAYPLDSAQDVPELVLDLVLFRKATGRVFGEDRARPHCDLKDAAGARND